MRKQSIAGLLEAKSEQAMIRGGTLYSKVTAGMCMVSLV